MDDLLLFVQIGHQIFRRHETYSIAIHALLLFGAPLLLTVGTASTLTFGALLSACWTYLATLILSILLYRLSHLHPLSKYPGPICCRASKLWHACVVLKGRQHEYLQALHERYGDVVRIGTRSYTVSALLQYLTRYQGRTTCLSATHLLFLRSWEPQVCRKARVRLSVNTPDGLLMLIATA